MLPAQIVVACLVSELVSSADAHKRHRQLPSERPHSVTSNTNGRTRTNDESNPHLLSRSRPRTRSTIQSTTPSDSQRTRQFGGNLATAQSPVASTRS